MVAGGGRRGGKQIAMASNKAPVFSPDVVKALLSQHFKQSTSKMSKPAAEAAATFLQLFAEEAFNRALKLATKDASSGAADDADDDGIMSVGASAGMSAPVIPGGVINVTPDHLRRILPALLLDF